SMFAVARLMDNTDWRMALVEKAYENPVTKAIAAEAYAFWSHAFPKWTTQQRSEGMAAARRRIKPFIDRPQMQFTLGLPGQTIDLAAALNEGKIILVPMHDDIGLESKRLLGAYIIREVLAAVKSRAHDAAASRQLTAIIIDEFPDFVGSMAEAVKDFLAQTRKYGVAITLLAQSIYQLPKDVQTEIHTNCGSLAFFRCTPEDAEIAARMLGHGVRPEDFWQLRPYHAYLKLMTAGGNLPPCSVKAYPPPPGSPSQGATSNLPKEIGVRDWMADVLEENGRPEMATLLLNPHRPVLPAQQELLTTLQRRIANLDELIRAAFVAKNTSFIVEKMQNLPPEQFSELKTDWREFLHWRRNRLLAAPCPPHFGNVAWLKHLSSLLVGYHWTICEAEYLRNHEQKSEPRQVKKANTPRVSRS
ncbi:MAG: TraM recognition domain-containing protein, partial [Anaerolineales bacterium]|nr:TraM recognition domain-containing protein [Anaerolineales bacterium]